MKSSTRRSQKKTPVDETGQLKKGLTAKAQAFLAAYSKCGSITGAAKAAGVARNSHYEWLKDEHYRAAFAEAKEQAVDALEDEAIRRAHAGSDTLLIFLLKGAKPEKYRERSEVTVPGLTDLVSRIAAGRQRAASTATA